MEVYWFEALNEITKKEFTTLLTCVSQERREKIDRYIFFKDQLLSVMSYTLLLFAYYEKTGELLYQPVFDYNFYGKPQLKESSNIAFNFSHSTDVVACGISTYEIGIDVQSIPKDELDIDLIYSTGELELIAKSEAPQREKIRLWTLKESYVKYTGQGITDQLKKLDFSSYNPTRGFKGTKLTTFEHERFYLSICGQCPCEKIKYISKEMIFQFLEDKYLSRRNL